MDAKSVQHPIPNSCIDDAVRCEKSHACLDNGPKCRAIASLNEAEALLVCQKTIGPCPYKTGSYLHEGEEFAVCSCPVRLAFWRLHAI